MLRAPWRLLAFALVAVSATFIVGWAVFTVAPAGTRASMMSQPSWQGLALSSLVVLIGLLIAHAVVLRWIDRLPWSYVGLGVRQATPGLFGSGFLLGALAIGIPSLVLVALGWLQPIGAPAGSWAAFALRAAVFLLPAALVEELIFRGYPFAVLRDAWGWKAALIVMSAVFGVAHVQNPGADPEAIVAVIIAGFFLGGILIATGSLFAAWMAHFAWNWAMAAFLHTAVSGLRLTAPDYRIIDAGPDWATGGKWGPEGGVGAVVGMLVALGLLYSWWQRRTPLAHNAIVNDMNSNDTVNQHHG